MFGIKKLKRRINDLDISRNEWMKIAKTALEEIKTLKEENDKLKSDDKKWKTRTSSLSEEIEKRNSTILKLQGEVNELKRDLFISEKDYKSDLKRVQDKTEHLMGIEIETLKKEIQRLTRKRDAKGRFVKMSSEFEEGNKATAWTASPDDMKIRREFKVGDKVKIKDGISSATHLNISPFFLPSMDKFIGDVHKINYIFSNESVRIGTCGFHPDWLEHAD